VSYLEEGVFVTALSFTFLAQVEVRTHRTLESDSLDIGLTVVTNDVRVLDLGLVFGLFLEVVLDETREGLVAVFFDFSSDNAHDLVDLVSFGQDLFFFGNLGFFLFRNLDRFDEFFLVSRFLVYSLLGYNLDDGLKDLVFN
jgi:hypothetical protein